MTRAPGHFGEWLQGRLGAGGPVVLVTLACPIAPVLPGGRDPLLPAQVIAKFCAALGVSDPSLPLEARMPLGAGTGASTAALLEIGRAAGVQDPDRLAAACLAAEGASDPLMFEQPDALLWAPREGRVLRKLSPPPLAEIAGGFFGPPTPTRAEDLAFPDVTDLVTAWERAGSLTDCAAVASQSADRCTAMRGPSGDPTGRLASDLGALGYARAHTGSARALIFAPGTVPPHALSVLTEAGLSGAFRFRTGAAP